MRTSHVRPSDIARAAIRLLASSADGRRVATLRFRHADYRTDRWWCWCDLEVVLPQDAPPLALADEIEFVLASVADASRMADGPGHYSCRLHPASEGPQLSPERAEDGVYGGLIERTEPPAGGELVLHLGSGVTCYPQLTGEGPFPPESLAHGEWSEFIFMEPHELCWLRKVAPKR
ncbi:MAG: hypothetical protein EXS13_03855 [Planctomycetes bacterium]|nr:hypothetical protein [Planctomycetota bacterium]